MEIREAFKGVAGRGLSFILPACSYENCIFLIGHMRCGSTALSNILCSRGDISGYGEAHISYTQETTPGLLALNQAKKRRWTFKAQFLYDKLLHNHLDDNPPPDFFSARAIFMVRRPEESIPSIVRLFQKIRSNEYGSFLKACAYYEARLEQMRDLWLHFGSERKTCINFEDLVAAPEEKLKRLSSALELSPPLKNQYAPDDVVKEPGVGDPFEATKHSKIVARKAPHMKALKLSDNERKALARASDAYDRFISETAR